MKLLILGTCVSRDALEYVSDGSIELTDYYARSSLASLNAVPFVDGIPHCVSGIPSSFGRKVVERDLTKRFFRDALVEKTDIVLVDLIDERFDLWVDDTTGRCCTLSDEIVRAGFAQEYKRGRTVRSGGAEFWDRWCEGWTRFLSYVTDRGLRRNIAINKVFWGAQTAAGRQFNWGVADNNTLLGRMYDYIARDLPQTQFLEYSPHLLVGDDSHRWGVAPFHYIPELYRETIRLLHEFDRMICVDAEQYERCSADAIELPTPASLIVTSQVSSRQASAFDTVGIDYDGRSLRAMLQRSLLASGVSVALRRNGDIVARKGHVEAGAIVFELAERDGMYWLEAETGEVGTRSAAACSVPVCSNLPRYRGEAFMASMNRPMAFEHVAGGRLFQVLFRPGEARELVVLVGSEQTFGNMALIIGAQDGTCDKPRVDGALLCLLDSHRRSDRVQAFGLESLQRTDDTVIAELSTLVRDIAGKLTIDISAICICGVGIGGITALRLAALLDGAAGIATNVLADLTNCLANERLATSRGIGTEKDEVGIEPDSESGLVDTLSFVRGSYDSRFYIFEDIRHRAAWEEYFKPAWTAVGGVYRDVDVNSPLSDRQYLKAYRNSANVCSLDGEVLMKEMFRRLIGRDVLYSIESLVLTSEIVWFDTGAKSTDIVIQAGLENYPTGKRGASLAVFEFNLEPDEAALARAGISKSDFGYYRYLDSSVRDDALEFVVSLEGLACRRFGLRTWSWAYPIFINNLTVNHKPSVAQSIAPSYQVKSLEAWRADDDGLPLIHGNLLSICDACIADAECANHNKRWHANMAEANRSNRYYGVEDHLFDVDGRKLFARTYTGKPSFLAVPKSHADYLKFIGGSSRNMIRKARRHGYEYKAANPDDYPDDILEIRTSTEIRQGKKIPAYFYERPQSILLKHACPRHREIFFGAFLDGRIRAYITMFCYGEILQINHILGHHDHLGSGVMNLLMSEAVREIIETMPWVRGINYLYQGNVGAGLNVFKTGLGFRRSRVIVYDVGPNLDAKVKRYLDVPKQDDVVDVPLAHAGEKTRKAESRRIKEVEIAWSAHERVDDALRAISDQLGDLTRIVATVDSGIGLADLPSGASGFVVECKEPAAVSRVLTKGLKELGTELGAGAKLVFHITANQASDSGRRAADFLRRRSGTDALTPGAVRNIFKGSHFVPTSVVKYGDADDKWSSLIVVDKID
ncbi:DUF6270 domain-containing protein [Burkholderia multivorans]|uniref:DUF6270 domain-containing protein n=1 Tax=Burkholderia multivorans TaxID=87883 RepID=UPI002019E478|nr:DUF6270 domain-containing protein [Burkholderia multivorans]UQP00544.1 DUF6270 domain-containing protein [Burkholderia multivorans]